LQQFIWVARFNQIWQKAAVGEAQCKLALSSGDALFAGGDR
jgi:hypothetical protein